MRCYTATIMCAFLATTFAEPKTVPVEVVDVKFDPPHIEINKGDSVAWTVKVGQHNVIHGDNCQSQGAKFKSSMMTPGAPSYIYRFDQVGTYPYFCEPHCALNMKGSVTVK
ncbi:hypothetical protein BGZ83_000007 [Gryganskiella cystojenkinii]|nr:hypothetical protein BGZ83_000007 [Gryganskiella cystojenkinii]